MKNYLILVLVATCAGCLGSLITNALTAPGNVAKARGTRIERPTSNPEQSEPPPTVIERQVLVHDLPSMPSASATAEKQALAPKVEEPINIAAELESKFQDDRASTEEARKSESELRSAFGDPNVKGVRVDRIDCKAVTCRIELTFDSPQADKDALRTMFRTRGGISSHGKAVVIPIRHTNPDGTVAATMYYLPPPPAPPRPGTT